MFKLFTFLKIAWKVRKLLLAAAIVANYGNKIVKFWKHMQKKLKENENKKD